MRSGGVHVLVEGRSVGGEMRCGCRSREVKRCMTGGGGGAERTTAISSGGLCCGFVQVEV
jgi:hypothetical protein